MHSTSVWAGPNQPTVSKESRQQEGRLQIEAPAGYLRAPMPRAGRAQRVLLGWLGPEQPLISMLQGFVAAKDEDSLRLVCEGQTSMHQLLDERTHGVREVPDLGMPYRPGDAATVAALRASAALGLALLESSPEPWLEVASRWFPRSHAVSTAGTADLRGAKRRLAPQVAAVIARLPASGQIAPAVAAFLQHLAGAPLSDQPSVGTTVLLEGGAARGLAARLTLRLEPRLPSGLTADPRRMMLFAGDEGFRSALDRAWRATPAWRLGSGVLWSLEADGAPLTHAYEESLGAAFAVLLAELHRRRGPLRRGLDPRRLRAQTAIVGSLGDGDEIRSVGGYEGKLKALGPARRVVVPTADRKRCRELDDTLDIVGAADWPAAWRAARGNDRASILRLGAAIAIVVLVAVAAFLTLNSRQEADNAHQARLGEAAARVANEAQNLSEGDADGTGLLLAMASDELAARAGRRTHVLAGVSVDAESLVRILRGPSDYSDGAIAPDGAAALLRTETGVVQLVDTFDGRVEWEHAYPPGLALFSGQTQITALAFSPDSRRAAFATSAEDVVFLEEGPHGWHKAASVQLGLPVQGDALDLNRNYAAKLAFSADGDSLYAYGDTIGLFQISMAGDIGGRCPRVGNVKSLERGQGGALLTYHGRVAELSLGSCRLHTVLRASPDENLIDAVEGSNGGVTAVARVGGQVQELQPGRPPQMIVGRGVSEVRLFQAEEGLLMTAGYVDGTSGWSLNPISGVFGFRAAGIALTSGGRAVLIHDGIAEVHTVGSNTFASLQEIPDPGIFRLAWAGQRTLLLGNLVGAEVIPDATADDALDRARSLRFPIPGQPVQISGDASGEWAAAIVQTEHKGRQVIAWPLPAGEPEFLPARIGDAPLALQFSRETLYVGWRSGWVQVLKPQGAQWAHASSVKLNGEPVAFATSHPGRLDVLLTKSPSSSPEVARLVEGGGGLEVVDEASLSGTGPTGTAALLDLPDGRVMAAYGDGTAVFLTGGLKRDGPPVHDRVSILTSAADVPRTGEALVTGTLETAAIDTSSHEALATKAWSRAGVMTAASTSASGRYIATADFGSSSVTVWSLEKKALQRRACAAVGRNLTIPEWHHYVGRDIEYIRVCPDQPVVSP
ncbi:MAG TPA: hypothetical protein VMT37_09915 [Solirubrobacterales bacterium]|nr:hypothetical protein [Solirubrobacterales bacterium]